jgi:histidinol-phosphate phosphatase family protein
MRIADAADSLGARAGGPPCDLPMYTPVSVSVAVPALALRAAPPPSPARGAPAVFVDKDGTLVEDLPYNVDPTRMCFTARALPALRLLSARGFQIVVVTNQPGVALGYFSLDALHRLRRALARRLARAGVPLAGFYACPHEPAPGPEPLCGCRKPAPGLLQLAARTHGLDLAQSWMVGDILDDVEAGRRAGCRTVLLDVGHETVWRPGPLRVPHGRAHDLHAAAEFILAHRQEAAFPEAAPAPALR